MTVTTDPEPRQDDPVTASPVDELVPPNPDVPAEPGVRAKRPTTRAGRKAAAAAKAAAAPQKPAKPAGGDSKPRPSPAAPRKATLETRLATFLTTCGLGVAAVGGATRQPLVQVDGVIVIENAPPVAKALADVAAGNPAVAAALERVLAAGTYAALTAALMPIVVGIAANHGLVPVPLAAQLGVTVPEVPTDPATPSPAAGPAQPAAPGSVNLS